MRVQGVSFRDSSHSAVYRRKAPYRPRAATRFPLREPAECRFAHPRGRTLRYPFIKRPVNPTLQHLLQLLHHRDPRTITGVLVGAVVLAVIVGFVIRAMRPSPEEVERRRRERLATTGRITDGVIVDARTLSGEDSVSPTPEVLVYSYRLAGVTYNCAQDVSRLPEQVRGFRIDQPVQVRYDQRNPGNSVLVSESWTGLWQK
jgi:hypothetical protein